MNAKKCHFLWETLQSCVCCCSVSISIKLFAVTMLRNTSLHINGLVQGRRNSIANTLEFSLSCTNPSLYTGHAVCWLATAIREANNNKFSISPCVRNIIKCWWLITWIWLYFYYKHSWIIPVLFTRTFVCSWICNYVRKINVQAAMLVQTNLFPAIFTTNVVSGSDTEIWKIL